jgi:hypothetical protein
LDAPTDVSDNVLVCRCNFWRLKKLNLRVRARTSANAHPALPFDSTALGSGEEVGREVFSLISRPLQHPVSVYSIKAFSWFSILASLTTDNGDE